MIGSPSSARLEATASASTNADLGRLVRDVGVGRAGADRELVDRFKNHVRRILSRTLGPGPDVDDLLQEVFFRVFRRLHKVEPPDALPGYVTAVTVLVAREALRKRRRSRWLSFFSSEELAEVTRARGAADVPEDVRSFYGAVSKLSAHAQLCITLRYVEGMSIDEMGVAIDASAATVKRHLRRAEEELLALLGNDGLAIAPWLRGEIR